MNPGNDFGSLLACRLRHGLATCPAALRRLWQERHAIAATEFAMILPFMIILLIGMAEITGAMNHDRKISRISNSIADLVAQAQTVTTGELDGVFNLGEKILVPYPADELVILIASVTFDNNEDATVDWSYDSTGNAPWTEGAAPPITLPDTIAAPNTSIVVSVATLDYEPPFAGIFTSYFDRDALIELSDSYYLRPRLTNTVQCSNCP
ncbi:TadE/TadG family type IV pilus assembly protein [Roseibium sp. AS2]|uniref:TadE/TadG family type IV pilus assembly protein n=1 Tax=Roseibium sp. AS2 TaxID=3135781 RepID=UPI00316B147C